MIDKIIEAAILCFSKNGFHRTTIDDIAKELNASKGAIYYYFNNKSDIIYAVIEKGVKTINEYWRSEYSKDQPISQMLRNVIRTYVEFSFDFPELINVTYSEATLGLDNELAEKIKKLQNTTIELVSYELTYGKEINVVKHEIDTEAIAAGLIGMVTSICIKNMEKDNPLTQEELLASIFSVISTGIYQEDRTKVPSRIKF